MVYLGFAVYDLRAQRGNRAAPLNSIPAVPTLIGPLTRRARLSGRMDKGLRSRAAKEAPGALNQAPEAGIYFERSLSEDGRMIAQVREQVNNFVSFYAIG